MLTFSDRSLQEVPFLHFRIPRQPDPVSGVHPVCPLSVVGRRPADEVKRNTDGVIELTDDIIHAIAISRAAITWCVAAAIILTMDGQLTLPHSHQPHTPCVFMSLTATCGQPLQPAQSLCWTSVCACRQWHVITFSALDNGRLCAGVCALNKRKPTQPLRPAVTPAASCRGQWYGSSWRTCVSTEVSNAELRPCTKS